MKKLICTFVLLFAASIVFTACDNEEQPAGHVSVRSITLEPSEISIALGAPTLSLRATITPANATNRAVTWTSSNHAVATIRNDSIFAVSVGTATITVTTVDGGHTDSTNITVTPAAP